MAIKTIYYYVAQLFDKDTGNEVECTLLKNEIISIINTHSNPNGAYHTLDLTIAGDNMRTTLDVSSYLNDMLYCRLSRQRPINSLLKRNYLTLIEDVVLDEVEALDNGIEAFTFSMLDYTTGVFGVVSAMGAPNERTIIRLFDKFSTRYEIELQEIPNIDAIRSVYMGENPTISKIELEMPVPDAEIMQRLFGWERDEITDTVLERGIKAVVCIKSPTREYLVRDEDVPPLIDKLKGILGENNNITVTGKAKDVKAKDYDLKGEYFSYKIDVRTYTIENGVRYDYTIGNLTSIYREKILLSYRANREMICMITGRNAGRRVDGE